MNMTRQSQYVSQPAVVSAMQTQRGMSMLGMLVAILLGGLLITCVLKMVPAYIESWNVRSILQDLDQQFEGVAVVEKRAIRSKLNKRMHIDMIDAIQPGDISIEKERDVYIVSANYEKRVSLIGNVDVVMKFEDNVVEIPISR